MKFLRVSASLLFWWVQLDGQLRETSTPSTSLLYDATKILLTLSWAPVSYTTIAATLIIEAAIY